MAEDVRVVGPGPGFRADAYQCALWNTMGRLLEGAAVHVGADMAVSIVMSRALREVRRRVGVQGAKDALRGMIDTMDEAARYDAED